MMFLRNKKKDVICGGMNEMTTEGKTLGDAVVIIADKMQLPAEHIYEVIVKAQVLIGILDVITLIVVAISAIVSFYFIHRYFRIKNTFYNDEVLNIIVSVFASFILSVCVMLFMMLISEAVMSICMPEYAAIKMIGKMLGTII
jgi:hypothetical protein